MARVMYDDVKRLKSHFFHEEKKVTYSPTQEKSLAPPSSYDSSASKAAREKNEKAN